MQAPAGQTRPQGLVGTSFRIGYVELDDHRFRYEEGGEGPPLVCLGPAGLRISHGYQLLAEQFRMVAFDVARFQETPADRPSAISEDLPLLLARAVDALGIDSFSLMGSGSGASLALELAIQRPEGIKSLILAAPTGPDDGKPSDPELEGQLASVTTPVLVLVGTEDRAAPSGVAVACRQQLPSCHYVLVYGAGPAIEDDRPQAFASVVSDFVERTQGFIVSERSGLINP